MIILIRGLSRLNLSHSSCNLCPRILIPFVTVTILDSRTLGGALLSTRRSKLGSESAMYSHTTLNLPENWYCESCRTFISYGLLKNMKCTRSGLRQRCARCNEIFPNWVIVIHKGFCMNCAVQVYAQSKEPDWTRTNSTSYRPFDAVKDYT